MRKVSLWIIAIVFLFVLVGCAEKEVISETEGEIEKVFQADFQGDPVQSYDVVYTLEKVMSLTFDSVLPKDEFLPLLDELDKHQLKATFFVSLDELEANADVLKEAIDRGHRIESNALVNADLESLEAEDLFNLIKQTNAAIEKLTGKQATYLRLHKPNDEVNSVAAQLDMSGVVHAFGVKTDNEETIAKNMRQAIGRGKIITLDPEDVHAISYLADAADEIDFEFVSLDELVTYDQGRLDFEDIDGSDAIQENPDQADVEPLLHYQEDTDKKEVALTFDDWASEAVVLEVLDILDEYDIQSTFYVKTSNVHKNPNLARVLIERGHEVANHTHSHYDSTEIEPEELQKDVYKAHQIITEAIQEQPTLYFRPPFGRINDDAAQAITAMGYEAIGMYNISSYDWNEEYTQEDVINRVMTNVQPGSVIVMHILDDIHTPDVLPDLIETLQAEGYEFVKTSDWIEA